MDFPKPMHRSRQGEGGGGGGGGTGGPAPPPPLKNHKAIWFLSNTGPDALKNYKATKPDFNVGPSSASQRNAITVLLIVVIAVFGSSLPSKKNGPTLAKLSGICACRPVDTIGMG